MLNIDIFSGINQDFLASESYYKEYHLGVGPRIEIEKRKVNTLESLFGEIGGLFGFYFSIVWFLIGKFQANYFFFDSIKSLFMINISNDRRA